MSLCKYYFFQTMQKVHDFEKRCIKAVCRFLPVYYRDKRPQNRRNDTYEILGSILPWAENTRMHKRTRKIEHIVSSHIPS